MKNAPTNWQGRAVRSLTAARMLSGSQGTASPCPFPSTPNDQPSTNGDPGASRSGQKSNQQEKIKPKSNRPTNQNQAKNKPIKPFLNLFKPKKWPRHLPLLALPLTGLRQQLSTFNLQQNHFSINHLKNHLR